MNATHWLDKEAYPFENRWITIDGHQMHYIDEGEGPVLFMVHGTPTWSFDFRQMIRELSADYRCVAIDHIGFGLSEKPKDYPYSSQQHAENLAEFIDKMDFSSMKMVVHDFGGPIGLSYALHHPQKVSGVIVMNTWLWSAEGTPAFEKMKKVLKSPLMPILYKYFNFSAKMLIPFGFFDKKKLSKAVHRQYIKPFSRKKERYGPLGFARSLLHEQQWFESLWQSREAINSIPVLFVWGMKDKLVTPDYLQRFTDFFTDHTTCELQNAGHWPLEEEPGRALPAIKEWLKTQ